MHLTMEAQKRCKPSIRHGSIAIDATAGNGFDTLFLAESVGPDGKVYAVDIQSDAIERTKTKLLLAGLDDRVECVQADHGRLGDLVPRHLYGKVSCAMLNLGYLPHSDKSIVTQASTTIQALDAIDRMLACDAVLSILAYVGHPTGRQEALEVQRWIESRTVDPMHRTYENQCLVDQTNPSSPILWLLKKLGSNPMD
jgi:tRNA A58 N-methylase Trm61